MDIAGAVITFVFGFMVGRAYHKVTSGQLATEEEIFEAGVIEGQHAGQAQGYWDGLRDGSDQERERIMRLLT